jgi:hypothetical protein
MTLPQYSIVQYVRNKNHEPRGVLVAIKSPDGYNIGYSLCSKYDRFEKKMALKIALGRAIVGDSSTVPYVISKALPQFLMRCQRYYKTNE